MKKSKQISGIIAIAVTMFVACKKEIYSDGSKVLPPAQNQVMAKTTPASHPYAGTGTLGDSTTKGN